MLFLPTTLYFHCQGCFVTIVSATAQYYSVSLFVACVKVPPIHADAVFIRFFIPQKIIFFYRKLLVVLFEEVEV